MTYPRLRLAVATCLFLGWIGFLAYLVVRTRDPVILSRPQFLETDLIVVVDVREKNGAPDADIAVKETLWPPDAKAPAALYLPALRDIAHEQGWRGPGEYIVPLRTRGAGYDISALPWSPGFSPKVQVEIVDLGKQKQNVLDWLRAHTPVPENEANEASGKRPVVVRRNLLAYGDATKDLRKRLEDLGATVRETMGEYRIYLATPDARAQVRQIKG